jgi:hypothetical protein
MTELLWVAHCTACDRFDYIGGTWLTSDRAPITLGECPACGAGGRELAEVDIDDLGDAGA